MNDTNAFAQSALQGSRSSATTVGLCTQRERDLSSGSPAACFC
jgi:hypothetical protein